LTAFLAVNDLTAVGAMKGIKSRGLQIPGDVAVVGFGDDSTLSEMVDPALSSVVQPGFRYGNCSHPTAAGRRSMVATKVLRSSYSSETSLKDQGIFQEKIQSESANSTAPALSRDLV
jgi:hypothetical protein